jgi:hypothetical protein
MIRIGAATMVPIIAMCRKLESQRERSSIVVTPVRCRHIPSSSHPAPNVRAQHASVQSTRFAPIRLLSGYRMEHVLIETHQSGTPARLRIALIAHDNKKQDLVEWARYNQPLLEQHTLSATGTTGRMLQDELGLEVYCHRSGPLGGDLQLDVLQDRLGAAGRRGGDGL